MVSVPVHSKEDKAMKNAKGNNMLAKLASSVAATMMTSAANSRCVFVYHQPKQPAELKKLKKF